MLVWMGPVVVTVSCGLAVVVRNEDEPWLEEPLLEPSDGLEPGPLLEESDPEPLKPSPLP